MSALVFPLVWIAWLVYWWSSAFNVKPTERSETTVSRALYSVPTYLGALLLVARRWWPGWLVARLVPPGPASYWTGLVLLLAGIGFACWARVIIGGNWSSNVTLKSGHELIRTGPYRWVRHPIYTGLVAALLGSAIAQGALRSFLGLALITGAFIYKLGIEERMLSERFGEEYARYRKEVPALIPGMF